MVGDKAGSANVLSLKQPTYWSSLSTAAAIGLHALHDQGISYKMQGSMRLLASRLVGPCRNRHEELRLLLAACAA